MSLELTSPAFEPGQPIPARYTCDGENISPPLRWSDPPKGTQSFALIMDDPDAPIGVWDHWVIFNLAGDLDGLSEKVTPPVTSREGQNSWGTMGYGGPCPPGGTHRYFFRLYALDTKLSLPTGATKKQLLKAMAGQILAQHEQLLCVQLGYSISCDDLGNRLGGGSERPGDTGQGEADGATHSTKIIKGIARPTSHLVPTD